MKVSTALKPIRDPPIASGANVRPSLKSRSRPMGSAAVNRWARWGIWGIFRRLSPDPARCSDPLHYSDWPGRDIVGQGHRFRPHNGCFVMPSVDCREAIVIIILPYQFTSFR